MSGAPSARSISDLTLHCIPPLPEHVARPWDTADEYLLTETSADKISVIVNDRFGALFCARPQAFAWSDSISARNNWLSNAQENHLPDAGEQRILSQLQDIPADTEQVLLRIPKNSEQLIYWLNIITKAAPHAVIYLAGMAKHIPVALLKQLESASQRYQQWPIRKKARLLEIEGWRSPAIQEFKGYRTDTGLQLGAQPGVFSRDSQDIASYLLLANIECPANARHLIDLGCGNGLLGLTLAQRWPHINITAIDDSLCAVESCRRNATENQLPLSAVHNDSLTGLDAEADIIVCNPPFHDGHRQTTDIALRMFRDASEHLTDSGELWVIANRHLPYFAALKRTFRQVTTVASDKRFNLFRARK